MYHSTFYGDMGASPVIINSDRRQNSECMRSWSFMTPYLLSKIVNVNDMVAAVLFSAKNHGLEAATLMHYAKCRDLDESVITWAWSLQLIVDTKESTATITNDVLLESRAAMLTTIPDFMFTSLTKGTPDDIKAASSAISHSMGVATAHSVEEAVDYCVMVQHLRAKLGPGPAITNIDKYWYADHADTEPQVHHFKLRELPSKAESIPVLGTGIDGTTPDADS